MLRSLYYALVRARVRLFESGWVQKVRVPCPVISIGNLAWGGAGKTPCVLDLAVRLSSEGKRLCVIARGYRGTRAKREIFRVTAETPSEEAGDEAVLLARRLGEAVPVYVGPQKARTAEFAFRRENPQCILVDDGFSHLKLHRDLDILVLDAASPFRSGSAPGGILREPPEHAARADGFILTRTDRAGWEELRSAAIGIARNNSRAPVAENRFQPEGWWDAGAQRLLPSDHLKEKPVGAFAGIVDAEDFRRSLESCGCGVAWMEPFPDHHAYSDEELDRLRTRAERDAVRLVTTEKDLVRLPKDFPALALRIRIAWGRGFGRLDEKLRMIIG